MGSEQGMFSMIVIAVRSLNRRGITVNTPAVYSYVFAHFQVRIKWDEVDVVLAKHFYL